jgi:hypothetical protein
MAKRGINLEEMSTSELELLSRSAGELASGRRKKEAVERARKEGKAYARLEDVPVIEKHRHRFDKLGGSHGRGVEKYVCSCSIRLYKCGNCGYVPMEELRNKKYDNTGGLSGSAGHEEYCGNCGEHVGTVILKRS